MLTDTLLNAVDDVVTKYRDETQVVNSVDIKANLDTLYKKLEEEHFDLTELKPILECEDDMLIIAGAGVGKTTTIILKCIRDFLTGSALKTVGVPGVNGETTVVVKPMRILLGTFLKSGAEELKASFFSWCKKLGIKGISADSISFVTLHKEFIDAIKSFGADVKICEDSTTSDIVRSLMSKYNIHQQSGYSKTITIEEVNDIKGLFTYFRNRLDNDKFSHPLLREYGLDGAVLEQMLKEYNIHLNALGELDFEATQELLYKYLQVNPAIYNALKDRYDVVIVDEFQDTSQLQYEILKPYFDGAKKKIVIGDDDQTIYSWRGSDINIITHKFEEDYHPRIMNLTANHRCPQNILNPVIPSIMNNNNRHPKSLKASKEGGIVDVIYNITSDALVNSVKSDLEKYETVGIISRTNNDLLIPAILLELGCSVDFQTSKSITLNAKMPKSICSSIDLITKRYTNNFESIFKTIFPRQVYFEVTQLCNMLSLNPKVTLFNIDNADLEASVPNIAPFIKGLKKSKELGDIQAFLYIIEYMIKMTFSRETNYCIKARTFATFVKDLITNSTLTANMDIYAIDRLLNAELPARIAKRNKPIANPRIKLTTVHDAKGKEWDSVYIWNDINGTFPSAMARESSEMEYEEERRLHYIAWTRAKKHLTVCTSTKNPSPFLLECRLPNIGVPKANSLVIDEHKMINVKDDTKVRVSEFLKRYMSSETTNSANADKVIQEDVNILLGFADIATIVDKTVELMYADRTSNVKSDNCIIKSLHMLAQQYIDEYCDTDIE